MLKHSENIFLKTLQKLDSDTSKTEIAFFIKISPCNYSLCYNYTSWYNYDITNIRISQQKNKKLAKNFCSIMSLQFRTYIEFTLPDCIACHSKKKGAYCISKQIESVYLVYLCKITNSP